MIVSAEEAAAYLSSLGANDADPTFRRIVFAVNADVENRCGRKFVRAERTEIVRGYGQDVVFLRETPVVSISEVRIDATGEFGADTIVADLTKFRFAAFTEDPRLYYLDGIFPEGARTVQVTYVGGYVAAPTNTPPTLEDADAETSASMPEDLRLVVFDEIAARWKRGTSEQLKSESIGSYSYTRFDERDSPAAKVLNRYRR